MERNIFYNRSRYVLLLDIVIIIFFGFLFLAIGMTVKAHYLNLALVATFSAMILLSVLKRKVFIKDMLTNKFILLKVCPERAEFILTTSGMCVPFRNADVQIIRETFLLNEQYQSGCIEEESCYSDSCWTNTSLYTSIRITINGVDFSASKLTERDIQRMLTVMDNLARDYGVNVDRLDYTYDYRLESNLYDLD